MVPSLRNRHRQIWLLLAVVLPVVFVAAVMAIEQPVAGAATGDEAALPAMALIKGSGHSKLMDVVIRSEPGAAIYQQLEIRLKKALAAPESLVYLDANNSAYLIGRLGNRGLHRYDIGRIRLRDSLGVVVRLLDPIHFRDIHRVYLKKTKS